MFHDVFQIFSGKFDFGDRDGKPAYDIILPPLKEVTMFLSIFIMVILFIFKR